ncbi:complement C1q-like protein 2 [Ruditapes philippinarum]|uniref:complement C1q-like protein 2 n=1 Tax=Ruditapes philippinarum TaxID=129788 RepID=UPI00295B794E|nr:complement C1q-like protein 2 [Ruditapes philippinarum]
MVQLRPRSIEELSIESNSLDEDTNLETLSEDTTDISEPGASTVKDPDNGLSTWYGGSKIAFSAFLSKRYDLLGKGQHVKFDKVLLNDGDGYEAVTGVFRTQTTGVYVFTYAIAQRNINEVRVNLMYDGNIVNGAIAEGMHKYHDAQGTNTAIIHVVKGKPVWIEAASRGALEGNDGDGRYTTFSGFLLYARN